MRIDDPGLSWPLLTLDRAALEHNVTTVAAAVSTAGAELAPHVKTHMSPELWARQRAAGAWGATLATPTQLRTALGWSTVPRALLANELVDPRDLAWLRAALERGDAEEVWVYVDSAPGVELLAAAFDGASRAGRLGVLVEVGVPGGRTGVRTVPDAVALARDVVGCGLRLVGVAGYEGPVAAVTSEEGLAAVARWCATLREAGEAVAPLVDGPVVLSAGGSAFADVVLHELTAAAGARVVLRSGAYVTSDHGHYRRSDPWRRLGAAALRPAITVWASVLSVPEPGLAICGLGRRDVSSDLDLPFPLVVRPVDGAGRLGEPRTLDGARVTALNDQHAYLAVPDGAPLRPGEVVGFGVSHPCTTLDRHRTGVVTDGDAVVEQVTFRF
ncbi:alanine racemase [Isoptericola variabilis]|uniref:Alanine racemase domain protein n=1 Tax=Isoptericola variabilis (strain 225) TaxID=743718 RepID=F6FQC6_ISOV2|nr:alanine racemase [Isoptericola variabilis]AEG43801.1 alanine racemase domain protein [Isoptericola variabilis 225]TWH34101.1 D-serine deaminase-like pyridoxal phosphate-dependent protein [Isoptericola variabilis J7]